MSYTQNEQVLATVSGDGTLVYREGSRGTLSQLVWVDRKGLGTSGIREREVVSTFELSHDGSRLAISGHGVGQGSSEVWVQDLVRGAASRLTFEEGSETFPAWSGDDRFVYYANDRRNDGVIFRRRADGTGSPEEIGTTDQGIWPMAASRDGRWLVVGGVGAGSGRDLFRFDLATKKLEPLVTTPFHELDPALSPDDRLLAYACEESGRWEVYVQALGGERGRWQISSERGRRPRWRADGRELYFLAHPDRMMVVDVEPGEVPRFSPPRELFRLPADSFDVAPDGQRFAVSSFTDGGADKPLTLVTGWTQRMGEDRDRPPGRSGCTASDPTRSPPSSARADGRGLARDRHAAGPRRRAEAAPAGLLLRTRPARPLRARGEAPGLAQPSEHRHALRPRGDHGAAGARRWSSSRGRISPSG